MKIINDSNKINANPFNNKNEKQVNLFSSNIHVNNKSFISKDN